MDGRSEAQQAGARLEQARPYPRMRIMIVDQREIQAPRADAGYVTPL